VFDVFATDQQNQVTSRNFSIQYSPPPIWQSSQIEYAVSYGEPVSIQVSAVEASGSTIQYSSTALPGTLQLSTNGVLTGTISESENAIYPVTFTAVDLQGQQITKTINLVYTAYFYPTNGLIGLYNGDLYGTTVWNDQSGSGNHATIGGSGLGTSTLNGKTILTGTTATTILWPTTILPSTYTLIHLARYLPSGGTNARIFRGNAQNWLSGFWNGNTGVAYHNGWITASASTVPNDWVFSTDTNTTYRANQFLRGSSGAGSPNYDRLAVNTTGEPSHFMIAEVLVYNRTLTEAEMIQTENYLMAKYVNLPAPVLALSARRLTIPNNGTVSSWASFGSDQRNAIGYAVGGASLPIFNAPSKYVQFTGTSSTVGSYFDFGSTVWNTATSGGFSFAGYVQFPTSRNYERIFDFGNGAGIDNLLFGRLSTGSSLLMNVEDPNFSYQPSGLIVNGTWQTFAHRLQQESANVWRWTVWVDGNRVQSGTTTITMVNRIHANSYSGRSHWSADDYSAMYLREAWWYDEPLSDTQMVRAMSKVREGY